MDDKLSHPLLAPLQALHWRIRDEVVASTERAAVDVLSHVHADDEGDTIYAIDKVAEDVLVEEIDRTIARDHGPVILVAEGLPRGRVVLPRGAAAADARWTIIVDPIDGTRGLMYQKRPAWILTGVAEHQPNQLRQLGQPAQPGLSDIVLALQTEIPLVKQHLCDQLWAVAGEGTHAVRVNRLTGREEPLPLRPSRSTTLAHGFATVARFFPGVRAELAALDDEIAATLLGPPVAGKAQLFEDQYISSGGQLYELIVGHDRFVADLRSVARRVPGTPHTGTPALPHTGTSALPHVGTPAPRHRGTPNTLCCHPYDLCTELIARECGVVVTDEHGAPLDARLNVEADVSWVGYANAGLRDVVEPILQAALTARGWVA
jgi:fructose-1,6-bisphosphatase/inositol monophosphatase family enzyme